MGRFKRREEQPPKKKTQKSKPSGKRVGKSKASKANNQLNKRLK